jgi:hypothetical protein
MHKGQLHIEEKHPFLKKLVRFTFAANIGSAFVLWVLFVWTSMFTPYEQKFMGALLWFFFFGCVYGVFAFFAFIYAKYVERRAVDTALTPNRRYEWHTRYDTHNVTPEDMKKAPAVPGGNTEGGLEKDKGLGKAPPPPVGIGTEYYGHAALLSLCSLTSCAIGIYAFLHNMLQMFQWARFLNMLNL